MPSRTHIILIYSLIACVLLYITENIYHPVYSIQMFQKVVSFLLIPLILGYIWKQRVGRAGKMSRTSVIYGVSLGLVSMVVIGVTYMLLRDMIDWSAIRMSMESRGITETTFVLVFLYIMFGNSLLEEYFFRGIVHYNMSSISRVGAYVLSALMFSLYHITIFGTWFSGWILGLALF
ncbi:MAG: CPBP family intramembrane glutamic endopeptidase [Patescibacteria group bacterium]